MKNNIDNADNHGFGKDFLTGCLALLLIGAVLFILIPLLIFVLKVSVLIAVPVGLFVVLIILTAYFGRIINLLRRRW